MVSSEEPDLSTSMLRYSPKPFKQDLVLEVCCLGILCVNLA